MGTVYNMNGNVAKTYQDWEKLGDPYRADNFNLYIKVKNPKTNAEKAVRWYTSAELQKMYPDMIVTKERYFRSQKEVLGFDKGYITIFKDTGFEYLEWFRQSPCRFNKWFHWYLPSEYEMPEDAPAALVPIRLDWDQVGGEDGKLYDDDTVAKVIDSLIYEPSASKHQGNIGERIEFDGEVTHTADINSKYGNSTLHTFEDEAGNVYIWNTTSKTIPVGTKCHVRGTVKDHGLYRNVKQTVLTRCIIK